MKVTKRLEHKYFISYLDYFKIIDAIKNILIHDKHGENDSYQVTSIYLDDLVFSGASDKAFGNEVHKKYRIRYYDDISKKKLELKHKIGETSTKYSTPIDDALFHAIIDQDLDILHARIDDDLIRRFILDFYKSHLKPTCYIKYKREAYKDELNNLRLTFDHSVTVERFQKVETGMELKVMLDSNLILEIKYERYMPNFVKEILKKISLNQTAYSKYFLGFNSIDL